MGRSKWWHCVAGSPVDDKRVPSPVGTVDKDTIDFDTLSDVSDFGQTPPRESPKRETPKRETPKRKKERRSDEEKEQGTNGETYFPNGDHGTPSLVIPWVLHELNALPEQDANSSLPGGMSTTARKMLRAQRKAQYKLFAETLLTCWAAHKETFPQAFCDYVWQELSALQGGSAQTSESLIFVEEFLAGKEFDIAKWIERDGLSGQMLLPVVFEEFTAKASGQLTTIDNVYWTLLCPIVSGHPKSQSFPPWVKGEVYRDLKDKRVRIEVERNLRKYAYEANRTMDQRKVDAEEWRMLRRMKSDMAKPRPWVP